MANDTIEQLIDELRSEEGPTAKTPSGQQDMLLGQMFQTANDAIKDEFNRITMMDIAPRPANF